MKGLTNWLIIGGVALAGWYFFLGPGQMQAAQLFQGLWNSKANYAYPNFYPYGHPFYYLHMDDPSVRNNYGFGHVDVPRISNALAAKEIITGNKQYSHSNPMYDSNHIYSFIQEEY